MARVLTRPMFRKGGLSRETGIMSGLDRKGYAQGSYAPRVGYQKGSMWNPLNWFKRGVPVRQFGPVTGSYYQTHTMAPESAYSRLAKLKRFTGSGIRSLAVGATNGVDFAVNMAPVLTKLYDMAPVPLGGGGVLEASGAQEDLMTKAMKASDNIDQAREFLKNYKDDGNVVSKLVQVMGQDLMYSIPMYNKLKSVGVPTVPAFVISGGIGGAIGIEKKLKFKGDDKEQYNSTFTQDFYGRDIAEFKRLVGILPNTPYDNIADEVVQAF